jgi:hypothetical protein
VEFPPLTLAVIRPAASTASAAGSLLTAGRRSVAPDILLWGALPVSAGQLDLELIELIPLGVGPLPFRNRQERLQASAGGNRLLFIHGDIMKAKVERRKDARRGAEQGPRTCSGM